MIFLPPVDLDDRSFCVNDRKVSIFVKNGNLKHINVISVNTINEGRLFKLISLHFSSLWTESATFCLID